MMQIERGPPLCSLFMSTIDLVAPLKEVLIKQRSEPWMTNEILTNIRETDFLLAEFNKNKHMSEYYKEDCKLRNQDQREIRSAKKQYMLHQIEENRNDPKKLWQNLKDLGYQNKTKDSTNIVLDIVVRNVIRTKNLLTSSTSFLPV